MSERICLFAEYNRVMNEKIYLACSKLSADDLTEDMNTFFSSILGTLNHLVVADIIWLKRFNSLKPEITALAETQDWEFPKSLIDWPCANLDNWWRTRQMIDKLIISFAAEISQVHESAPLEYLDMTGKPHCKNFGLVLTHFFNHQTHHRGQLSTLLTRKNLDIGVTDILPLAPEL